MNLQTRRSFIYFPEHDNSQRHVRNACRFHKKVDYVTAQQNTRFSWSKSLPCTSCNLFSTISQYLENEFIMCRILLTWKPLRTRSNLLSNKSNIWTPQSNSILKIRKYNFFHQCVWVCVSWCVWQRAGKRESWTLTCFLRVCVFTIRVVSIVCVRLNVIEGELCVCVCVRVYFGMCVCVCMCYCCVWTICVCVRLCQCCWSWVWHPQKSLGLLAIRMHT